MDTASRASCTLGGHSGQGDGCPGVDLDDRHDTGLVLQFLGQPAQALIELAVGQDARAQPEDVVTQVTNDPVQLLHGATDAPLQVRVAGQRGRALQAKPNREQGLDDPIVQLLGDPLTVLEHGKPAQLLLEAGMLDRDGGLLGEGLGQLHVPFPERATTGRVGHQQGAKHGAADGQGREQGRADPSARRAGCRTRWSAAASGTATVLAASMTSPETDPSTGKTRPGQLLGVETVGRPHHQLARAGRDGQGGPDQLAGVTGNQPEDGAITTQDPEGAVAGAGQIGGQVDDALQDDRERQLRGKGEPGSSRRPVRSPWPIIAAA